MTNDELMERARIYIESRIVPEPNSGCWLWYGTINADGYGFTCINNKRKSAHRVSYTVYRGPIPNGMQIDHLCRVRCCVNPDHMEVVTQQENIRRGIVGENNRGKTHCLHGHPFDGDNLGLYFKDGKMIRRRCRACNRKRARRSNRIATAIRALQNEGT